MYHSSIKILLCLSLLGMTLYQLVEEQNELASLRVALPALEQEVKLLQSDILAMHSLLQAAEAPAHLLEWSRLPEYAELTYPYESDILFIPRNPSKPSP